jgi:hypothetical protein
MGKVQSRQLGGAHACAMPEGGLVVLPRGVLVDDLCGEVCLVAWGGLAVGSVPLRLRSLGFRGSVVVMRWHDMG